MLIPNDPLPDEAAGEAQGANQAPPRPDQPPGGSVCAPGGTARSIVPQTKFDYVPAAVGTGVFTWSGMVRWAVPGDPSQGVVTDSDMTCSLHADFSPGGAYSTLNYQFVLRDYEVIYWRSILQ